MTYSNSRINEHLLSEIFLVACSVKTLKRPITLSLPYYKENTDLYDFSLLWRKVDSEEWDQKECSFGVSNSS